MVTLQLEARGIRDPRVLAAMREVPRHQFVSEEQVELAYEDCALPIGEGQTISQPYVVAWMLEALALRAGDRALEVGAGSGYAAAILSRLVRAVFAIERDPALVREARRRLASRPRCSSSSRRAGGWCCRCAVRSATRRSCASSAAPTAGSTRATSARCSSCRWSSAPCW